MYTRFVSYEGKLHVLFRSRSEKYNRPSSFRFVNTVSKILFFCYVWVVIKQLLFVLQYKAFFNILISLKKSVK